RTTDHLAHSVDVFRTIMQLARCDEELWNPDGRTIDGVNLADILRNPDAEPARTGVYSEFYLPLDGTLTGPVPINAASWHRSYSDGEYKVIKKPASTEFYYVGNEVQSSGFAGYFEKEADDLFSLVNTAGNEVLT